MTDKRTYNFIYSKLVSGENDVLGAIAYSVYKRQKIETIKECERKLGRPPSEEDLQHFKDFSNSPSQIKFYQDQSFSLAQLFIDETFTEEIEQEISRRVRQEMAAMKPSFWYGVLQGLTASFLFVLAVGVLFFFTLSYNQGFEGAVENFFKIKIEYVRD